MDWNVLERRLIYQGFFRLEVLSLRHTLFTGDWSPTLQRETVTHKNAVAVLPYDPVEGNLVLIEQFRSGALGHPRGPWLTEIVAGLVEPGEQLEEVARRELIEETGCEALSLAPIMDWYPSPGGLCERVFLYLAHVDSRKTLPQAGLSDEGEDIRICVLPVTEAFALLEAGRIISASAIIGLQWLLTQFQRATETEGSTWP